MAKEGRALSEQEVRTVVDLLSTSQMTVSDIAQRVRLSRDIVLEINRRFKVRDFRGERALSPRTSSRLSLSSKSRGFQEG
jgi:hypothetical protein